MKKKILAAATLLSLSFGTASAQIVPELKTGNQKVDNTFKLSVEILYRNTENGLIKAGGGYGGEWTRDCSINSWNAASLLNPSSAETSLWAVTTDNRQYIGHQDWDQIIWVTGAYDYFEKTGDRNFLDQAYQTSKNTMARLEGYMFDNDYGMFKGPSVFNDGIAGYEEPIFRGNEYGTDVRGHWSGDIKCLSTNTIYYNAYLLLAKMANYKGETNEEKTYLKKAANLRSKIREHLLHGNKFYYLVCFDGNKHDFQEALGISFAVLFGVVDKKEAQDIIKNAYKGNYGTPSIYPHFKRFDDAHPGRHNKIVWPFVSAFFGSAANYAGVRDRFSYEINSLSTLCQGSNSKYNGQQTFFEIYNEITGVPDGGWQCGSHWGTSVHDQTWSCTGFIRLILTEMLGMRFNGEGLTFEPNIDIINEYGFQEIKKVTYRGGTLNITKSGNGNKLVAVRVNGVEQLPVTPIAPALGERNIELVFGNEQNLSSEYAQVDIEPRSNAYWNSANSFNNGTSNSNGFVATKIFSRDDLPTGTIIQVDDDYQYRPEAWETNNSTTDPRPETQCKSVTVSDTWWSYYGYRGFNVSKIDGGNLSIDDAKNHFRIYLPKVLGDGGDFTIISKSSGKPLAIANNSQNDNAGLVQNGNSTSDVWTFEYAGNGYYYIINKNSGKALDMPGGTGAEGTQPVQWTRNNDRNQQWNVINLGGGMYRISPKCNPRQALDVTGASADDNVAVVQWPYKASDNEVWYIKSTATETIIPFIQKNGDTWLQTASVTANIGDNIVIGPQPIDNGNWTWTGPNGFTSNNREVNLNNIKPSQAGTYTATYTSPQGNVSTKAFNITVDAYDASIIITPYVNDGYGWLESNNLAVSVGDNISLGPQVNEGGTWSWTGPNGFTSNNRQITINGVNMDQAGTYTATITTTDGRIGRAYIQVSVLNFAKSVIIPYMNGNNGWENTNTLYVNSGNSFSVGPQVEGIGFGNEASWRWAGPNGFTSEGREFTRTNVNASYSGVYRVYYTEDSGRRVIQDYTLYVDGAAQSLYFISDDDEASGIKEVKNGTKNSAIYDLQGRKVNRPVAGQIYITNGRKVVIKK